MLSIHPQCSSHMLVLLATSDASATVKNFAQFSCINHITMSRPKCLAACNSFSRLKSAEKTNEICGCNLPTPRASSADKINEVWNMVEIYQHYMIKGGTPFLQQQWSIGLPDKRHVLPKVMNQLKFPCFKVAELEFWDEYCHVMASKKTSLKRHDSTI